MKRKRCCLRTFLRQSEQVAAGSVLIAWTLIAGCGDVGPPRYTVKGSVDYGGKPVPAGRVVFEPALGNHGPAGYADIKDGAYVTIAGKGVVGGPHDVRAICLDGKPVPGELPNGRPLCSEYRISVELPHADTAYDIDIPASFR